MFEDATFHSNNTLPSQTPKWMLITLSFNLTLLAALVIWPLIYPASLPTRLLRRILYVPTAQSAPSQPHPTASAATPAQSPRNLYQAPTSIPTLISRDPVSAPPATISDLGPIQDAVPGGAPSTAIFQGAPPRVASAPIPQRVIISGGVTEGRRVFSTTPVYPPIALAVRVSGTIVLAATISQSGTIENLRVLSGPPMLRQSAIEAVQHWRYRPYLLNGQPVEVETTINVVFSLGSR
jgi:protein TonB